MARPMAPHNQRFAVISPRYQRGAVYAAEFTNGVVKVGYSRCPRHRMVLLSHEAQRFYATNIARFHIGPDLIDRRPYNVETRLIALASEFCQPLPGKREFFDGLSFDVAVALIKGLCADVPLRMQAGDEQKVAG